MFDSHCLLFFTSPLRIYKSLLFYSVAAGLFILFPALIFLCSIFWGFVHMFICHHDFSICYIASGFCVSIFPKPPLIQTHSFLFIYAANHSSSQQYLSFEVILLLFFASHNNNILSNQFPVTPNKTPKHFYMHTSTL